MTVDIKKKTYETVSFSYSEECYHEKFDKIKFTMDTNSVSPLPPPEAPLAMMESEKTPPRSPSGHDMPPPPDEK